MRSRTKRFALRIIRLFQRLPHSPEAQTLGKQLLRSGISIGANYRAAGRARSQAEFASKIGIVVEEADETVFWLECLLESGIVKKELLSDLLKETNEFARNFCGLASHKPQMKIDRSMTRSSDHPIRFDTLSERLL